MTNADRTLDSILQLMRADDVLTAEAKQKLLASVGTTKVSDLASHDGGSLAQFLASADPTLIDDCDIFAVAELLLKKFAQAGATAGAGQPAADAVAQAIKVQVELPRNIDQMSLREQLELLRDNPERADEILAYIGQQPQVQKALRKSDRLAVVSEGVLNVDETIKYVTHLAREYTQPTELVAGVRPTTLAKAAGTESRPYIHPFTGEPVEGADELGFDFSKLPEELHNALLWARVTEHAAWPTQIADRFTASEEVFATQLPRRWKLILDAYKAAKADSDEMALAINRFYPKNLMRQLGLDTPGGRRPFGGSLGAFQPERDEAWYQAQLEAICGREVEVGTGADRAARCVVRYVRVTSGAARLANVIVLGDVTVNSGAIDGTAYTKPGARIHCGSGILSRGVDRAPSWKALYDKAVEWGIIQS